MARRATEWLACALAGAAVSTAAAAQSTLVVIPSHELGALGPSIPLQDAVAPPVSQHQPATAELQRAATSIDANGSIQTDLADPTLPSEGVEQLTNWIIASHDNNGLPFMVIDKLAAEVFVHDADGNLIAAGPALLGLAKTDDSVPGVGKRKLSLIGNDAKSTPAGRFVARFGPARGHERVLWVDYADSVAMHPVITTNPKEKRMQRLRSPSPNDNRITFGCINVFPEFYKKVVKPTFKEDGGIVYILPEIKSLGEVFLAFRPVGEPAGN